MRGYLLQTLSRVSGYILQIKFYIFPRFQCFSVLITAMVDCMFSCFRTEMADQQLPFFILTAFFCYFREHKLTCPICALPDLLVSRLLYVHERVYCIHIYHIRPPLMYRFVWGIMQVDELFFSFCLFFFCQVESSEMLK